MHFHSFLLPVVTLTVCALAQDQSSPFNLVIQSTANETLNGVKLGSCHSGSEIEQLCLSSELGGDPATDKPFMEFYFYPSDIGSTGELEAGDLTWINIQGATQFNQTMGFFLNAASNVIQPLFGGISPAQPVAFTAEGLMAVGSNVDDATPVPYGYQNGNKYITNRWAICLGYFEGYIYSALQWVLGDKEPQNPTCQLVTVKRVFV